MRTHLSIERVSNGWLIDGGNGKKIVEHDYDKVLEFMRDYFFGEEK